MHELKFWKRPDDVPPSRRDFLTAVGFSVAASALSGCSRGAVQKAIPFLNKPETLTPGVANWYATTCGGCSAGCALLVKSRDGRPIKVEGNTESALFGGTCAAGQATVLSLYDGERLKGPLWLGHPQTWPEIDARIEARLAAASGRGQSIVLLSSTIISPSTQALVGDWARRYPTFRHVVYDAVSASALRSATDACFGVAGVPHYRFDRASTIVGLEADFLGTWLSPVEFTRQYARRRRPDGVAPMSRHIQFESGVSLTGGNADRRVAIAPSEHGAVALALLAEIARHAGAELAFAVPERWRDDRDIQSAANDLWRHRGASVVVSGSQDTATQIVVHAVNALLGNVGVTVDVEHVSRQKQGDDEAMARLVDDMVRGDVHVLMMHGVNPAYDFPEPQRFVSGMEAVAMTISFADSLDETSSRAHAVCPDHHFLEAWNDAEPVRSAFSLAQPTVAPLFNTRSAQDSLLKWLGETPDYYAYIRGYWRENLFPRQDRFADFDAFWDHALHDGVFDVRAPERQTSGAMRANWKGAAREVSERLERAAAAAPASAYELHLYETVAIGDGRHANNPWLQELPDPVTKVTWGNYGVLSPDAAAALEVASGDVVRVAIGPTAVDVPVHIQPGQSPRTVSIAVGYGRQRVGKVGHGIGANAFPLVALDGARRLYARTGVSVTPTGRHEPLAATQDHFSMEGRPLVRETTLAAFLRDPASGNAETSAGQASLWEERPHGDHQWGMVVDLNACTGCSACVTACQAENNVPVVGRDEVRRGREMHWLRVDTYVSGSDTDPQLSMQPMMCQHCEDAPCETVCPVLATLHSSDGINQQVYNRCIGTRYCANNCPYKVRRFNWFEYAQNERFDFNMNDPVGRMVLNPDVVVRSRGVMEKCSMCIQRIQAGKLQAKQEERPLADGDIRTACQQSCPAEAIVFGDLNDPKSRVAELRQSQRHYHVLQELGTRPHVGYLTRVRNPSEPTRS
jgi:Fe-S-cluster-containing dehydrogenase component/anaerobic selenocysteine-containing dehydrogenase